MKPRVWNERNFKIIFDRYTTEFDFNCANLEDCLLQVVKDAQTERSASIGRQACYKKFPISAKLPVETNRFGGIPVD